MRSQRLLSSACVAAALFAVSAPPPAAAQTTLTHTEDAGSVPAGVLRFRAVTGWTRFDERFTTAGTRGLGDALSSDTLGVAQLPLLAPAEASLQALTGNSAQRLTLGRLQAVSDARIVTTPFALDYGVTRRLSIGVVVPVVQTRRAVQLAVNADAVRAANVGFVAAGTRAAAATANLQFANAFASAASNLASLITTCRTNPAGAGCATVNANAADAEATRKLAQRLADAVRTGLGVDQASVTVAPRAGSALARDIDLQRLAANQRLQRYLGAGAGAASSVYSATSDFSLIDLQGRTGVPGLLQSPLGGGLDSLHTTEKLSIGDVEVGAQFLLFDHFQRDTLPRRRVQTRMTVGGSWRFDTARPDSANDILDIAAGNGAGAELRTAFDLVAGRIGATVAARYAKQFSRPRRGVLGGAASGDFPNPVFGAGTRTGGDVAGLDVTPRWLLTDWIALDAHYGVERATPYIFRSADGDLATTLAGSLLLPASTTSLVSQRVGFGVRYSTVDAYARGQTTWPVEVSFTHLETISGTAGTPKLFRDQVQMRLFLRVRGR